MKKHFAVLLLLLCLCLCCTLAAAAEGTMKQVSTFDEFKSALNDESIFEIQLTTDITFTENVTVNRSVWINLGTHSLLNPEPKGPTYTLTIAEGKVVWIGLYVGGTTSLSDLSEVHVDVVNNGEIKGSTAFHGHVTNNGTIASADYFYGSYSGSGTNHSHVTLRLNLNRFLWDKIPTGWTINNTDDTILKEFLRGPVDVDDLPTITRNGFTYTWYIATSEKNLTPVSPVNDDFIIETATTLVAVWKSTDDNNLYTLSFDGGSSATNEMDPIQVRKGETLLLPAPGFNHNDGLAFVGWSTDNTGKGSVYAKNDRFTFDGTKDITLYAQYSIITSSDAIYHVNYYLSASDAEPKLIGNYTLSHTDLPHTLKTLEELSASAPEGQQLAGWRVGTMVQTENGLDFKYDPDNTNPLKAGQKVTYPGYFITNEKSATLDLLAEYEDIPTPTPAPVPTASPAAPTPDIPQTSDSTPLYLWLALAVLSCIGIAAIAAHGKKQRTLFY